MGNRNPVYRSERRQKAVTELKGNAVGVLVQIIDELEGMNLHVWEIEAVLRLCGLNYNNALQMGAEIRAERVSKNDER